MVVKDIIQSDFGSSLKNDKKHRLKQRFDVQRKLGQGTYGKVQLAINRETGQEVAIKTIKKSKIESEQDLVRIRREIQIMSSIQHPHIIHIYEVFENKDKIVLVMQFANGGELYDYLSEKKVLSDLEARRIFRQIATAVYYCHKNKICHRDLKLENILLDEKGNAKIADFGLSNVFDEKHLLKTYCGSPLYASPEIVKGVPYYGPEVDCWSMGVLLYTLVYGAMPFDGSNFKKLVTQISEGDYFEPKKKSNASELIRRLLTVNPAKRATIVDICMDCWVNLGYEHSLLQVAEDMANLTPVRLDLLLALAPGSPIPEGDFPEQLLGDEMNLMTRDFDKDIPDEEDEDDEYNADTAANSFAFMKGSHASHLSVSSPNLQEALENTYEGDSETEFLPADIAVALQNEGAKRLAESSFGASLARISSLAHRSKKPRKSDSANISANQLLPEPSSPDSKKDEEKIINLVPKNNLNKDSSEKSNVSKISKSSSTLKNESQIDVKDKNNQLQTSDTNTEPQESKSPDSKQNEIIKPPTRRDSLTCSKVLEIGNMLQKRGSITENQEEKEKKKLGRPPGKIIIPKTFDSPQSTPSPKPVAIKKVDKNDSPEIKEFPQKEEKVRDAMEKQEEKETRSSNEDINKNVVATVDCVTDKKSPEISEEKKILAKGILKKGIAKAKLAERRISKQESLESDISSPPVSSVGTPEPTPSFFRLPKPYVKEEEKNMKSMAEIKLSSVQNSSSTLKSEAINNQSAPLWDNASSEHRLQDKDINWSNVSSTLDSEIIGWREQMEDSLRRLSPDNECLASNQNYSLRKTDDDKPLVPIARSYKKFTFTKDGACITETKKIYTTPGVDGSWTKVEKKTKITTRPGNAEEFEKFRDLHLRNASPLTRSDSQSSSGSNDVYDDIFDSWTGDTMVCNMRKMNNMFQKFSRDPFLYKGRRRNPFRFFRRADSERNERERQHYEIKGRRLSDKESSDNEEDYSLHFDDGNVVYGSQGLWQFLKSANRGFPGKVNIQQDPGSSGRSLSQDRSESKFDTNWKRCGSRASSGYNTGTRSQSRDRMESPREKVLRFVFESPHDGFSRESSMKGSPTRREKFLTKRNFSRHPRRDSGMGSDGYESEYSVHHSPSDDLSKTGRVSSMSSIYSGGRQDMIRHFMKSWSKEFTSPPMSPTSLGSAKEHLENLSESRKHRVEQWLHMNSDIPFEFNDETQSRINSRKPSSSHNSTSYATMHPREYLRYNRSSSDKISNYEADYFPSFGETYRIRSHSMNKDDLQSEMNKMRFGAVYTPVSEESSKGTYSIHHSDSSHSSSSIHHINFTISDNKVTSSHTTPHTRFTRSFNNGKDVQATIEATTPANVKFEQVTRNPGQPVVQMRVSFNRGNSENQVIHVSSQSPQSSKGLWEQQSSPKSLRSEISASAPRDTSPLPGIRQFSTEVHHTIGNAERPNRSTLECEITNSANESLSNAQSGNR